MEELVRHERKIALLHLHHHPRPHFFNCTFTKHSVISVLHYNSLFTLEERRNGAVIIHFLISLYCFTALAILCDHYFCASLEKLCKRLRIPTDVAGATFMAAGSSMPTLCIAIASVFMDEGDIGLGTIIGSTMFNILFITAVCGLCAGMVITLHTWPLIRDSFVYVVHLTGLLIVIQDNVVHFYEALLFPLLYSSYVVIMVFNTRLEKLFEKMCGSYCKYFRIHKGMEMVEMEDPRDFMNCNETPKDQDATENIENNVEDKILEEKESQEHETEKRSKHEEEPKSNFEEESEGTSHVHGFKPSSPFHMPEPLLKRSLWFILLPLHAIFYVTMPDCRKKEWESWYPVTFFLSIVWMAMISYVLVWTVSIIGETLSIPECIMGLTLLAAGSSVPDVVSSLVVAKHGMGDMALANCIGSNIFDILCLGLPWFLATTVVHPHSVVLIQSGHIIYTALCLFGTVFITLIAIHLNKWNLDKRLGCVLLFVYLLSLSVAVLLEALPGGPGGHGHEAKLIPHHPGHVPRKGLGHSRHQASANALHST
ncbi:sodium/potassium/calcium exchanger 3-like [Actinia tenebrosa]|uniref:Sodium/potassium/calcium exchanger 3-like n=1 Tax=Actinia tenebrosa TaxID=6105 RepID=A0A6P8HGV2_ACTTE|nr:sodium/potassium/calcium exchanger 3-like [Actinia tenebrosa]